MRNDDARVIAKLITGRPANETCNHKVALNPECPKMWKIYISYIRPESTSIVQGHSDKEENPVDALKTILDIIGHDKKIVKWSVYIVPQIRYTSPIAKENRWGSRGSRIAWDKSHDSFIELCETFGLDTTPETVTTTRTMTV